MLRKNEATRVEYGDYGNYINVVPTEVEIVDKNYCKVTFYYVNDPSNVDTFYSDRKEVDFESFGIEA